MRVRPIFFLALVASLAFSAGCSSSYGSPAAPSVPSPGTTLNVSIVRGASVLTDGAFAPNLDSIAVGDTLTWVNNDSTAHTTTADGGAWNSGTIAPGAAFSRTFAAPGTFTYHCLIPPGMVATVTVR